MRALKGCVEDPAVKEAVLAEREEAMKLGIRLTPTFFVNGAKIEGLPAMSVELEKLFPQKAESKKNR